MLDLEEGIGGLFEEASNLGREYFEGFIIRRLGGLGGRPKLPPDELRRRQRQRKKAYERRITAECKAKRRVTPGWESIERKARGDGNFKKGEWYSPDGSGQGQEAIDGVAGEGAIRERRAVEVIGIRNA